MFAVAILGAVVGAFLGFIGASLYYEPKIVARNRRIRSLERLDTGTSHAS